MKCVQLSLYFLIISCFSLNAQVTYVNSAANGADDGTSWADAYTNLSDALTNTMTGDIWVAKGLYTPSNVEADTFNSFVIYNPINIFGGFDGTESNIEQRNIVSNATILSGDILGDDASMIDIASTNDINSVDLLFVDASGGNYNITSESPAIDNGLAGAPEFDIFGNPRVGNPDSGAIENQDPTSIIEFLDNHGALSIFPNPVINKGQITLENNWRGTLVISLIDINGKVFSQKSYYKGEQTFSEYINTNPLDGGNYYLTVLNNNQIISVPFIKL
ncbi:MAG: T9SS type A sorting domain-containing protein [Saprospiraceae bacterium]